MAIDQLEKIRRSQEEERTQALAKRLGLFYINLIGYPLTYDTLINIPKELAEKYRAVVYLKASGKMRVATSQPENPELKTGLAPVTQALDVEIIYSVCSESSIAYALTLYETRVETKKFEEEVKLEKPSEEAFEKEVKGLVDLKEQIVKVPTTKLLEVILTGAIATRSSDIHIEPQEQEFALRYRIDGVLQSVGAFSKDAYNRLLSRVKFLTKMKLDTRGFPQDGRFSMAVGKKGVDLRVSLTPTIYGETVVMRLLEQDQKFLTLEQLGISEYSRKNIEKATARPTGMIINTGPTGSGKTTTLYAILDKLNTPEVKIFTLEDPVEYRLKGIVQSQINAESGYTFAMGLRSVLRQDPDIIMVGEIRDGETAEIGVQAALTGHLVLSTLHTNNAAGALPRLIDLGVPPFLMVSAINLIIAQRLVRRICPHCTEEFEPEVWVTEYIKSKLPKSYTSALPKTLKRGKGCVECNGIGFQGRFTIAESLYVDKQIEKLILEKASTSAIFEAAIAQGMITMEQEGVLRVLEGLTTIEEVLRVAQD